MDWEKRYRDLISGRWRGGTASVLRGLLAAAASLYGAGIYWRNRRFDRNAAAVHRVSVPVVSVGNLTTGGTGKTPMVAWIARWFRARGLSVALISRGYGAEVGVQNDEAMELAWQLPDVPHLQNPDRCAAAIAAIQQFACQVLVLDDAFQHRRIHRDLDVVLIDALAPFGCGHLLPRGLLREPLSALHRAQVVALTRSDLVSDEERDALKSRILGYAPEATCIEVAHRARSLVRAGGEPVDLASLQGRRVAAFCGIGNPLGFQRTLFHCGAQIIAFREFPDHFPFREVDVAALSAWVDALDVDLVLCTMKDLVKVCVEQLGRHPLRALAIDVELLAGREEFESHLSTIVARVAAR